MRPPKNAWNGMPSDPYALMENYVTNYNSPQPYLGFSPETETLDITLDGSTVTP